MGLQAALFVALIAVVFNFIWIPQYVNAAREYNFFFIEKYIICLNFTAIYLNVDYVCDKLNKHVIQ